jgi:N6-L-threonylcarbamoyladenine synthase
LPSFPLLALVVSGGHTDLVLIKDHGKLEYLGGTRDDAAGEAFDKTARLLGLPYPGGPLIAQKADEYRLKNPEKKLDIFPRPMMGEDNFEWSFSGLKTSVLSKINEIYGSKMKLSDYKEISENENVKEKISWLAAEIQEAVVDSLVFKSIKAIKKYKPKSFLLGGGVSANNRLREKFNLEIKKNNLDTKLFAPEPKLCTDSAAVIASCAFFHNHPLSWREVAANPELTITDLSFNI